MGVEVAGEMKINLNLSLSLIVNARIYFLKERFVMKLVKLIHSAAGCQPGSRVIRGVPNAKKSGMN